MFTGLIEETGVLSSFKRTAEGAAVFIECSNCLDDLSPGDSICVNGVCLTATEITATGFGSDISGETLKRSTFGRLSRGARVNLERALRLDSRLGGHILNGHVDGTGRVEQIPPGKSGDWEFSLPGSLERYIVEKGSIGIDGISLTVASVKPGSFRAAIIPETVRATHLEHKRVGDPVNLEVDILAKYVEKLLGAAALKTQKASSLESMLSKFGYLSGNSG